jgi:hypothetical protein
MLGRILLVWLCLAAFAHASVTVAWKLPVDVFAPGYRGLDPLGEEPPKKHKLAKPPGESVFFEAGDELWDVSQEVIQQARLRRKTGDPAKGIQWGGQWMVWNARSQMIVARGSEADIMMAGAALDLSVLPVLARTKLELVRGGDAKGREVSALSSSGETARVKVDGIEAAVRAVDGGWHGGLTEQDILLSWQSGEMKGEVSVHLDLYDLRTRIARFGSGEDQWEVFATGGMAYSHGVPISEVRWKEEHGKTVAWPLRETSESAIAPLDENLKIAIFKVRPDLPSLLGGGDDGEEDPFGGEDRPPALAMIPVSEELGRWMGGELLDLKPLLRRNGVKLDYPKAYAGYDRVSDRLFVIATPTELDLCELTVRGVGCSISRGAWTETDAASGNWGLACRSGEESWIKLSSGDRVAEFKIRPEFRESWPNVDTAYKMDSLVEGRVEGSFESRVKLLDAIPSQIGSCKPEDGKERKVMLTVDVGYP